MNFDRNLAKSIQDEATKALVDIAKKYNVDIRPAGGSLGIGEFSMKLKVTLKDVVKQYPTYVYDSLMLPKDIVGKTFESNGIKHTISEISTRSPKYPVPGII